MESLHYLELKYLLDVDSVWASSFNTNHFRNHHFRGKEGIYFFILKRKKRKKEQASCSLPTTEGNPLPATVFVLVKCTVKTDQV